MKDTSRAKSIWHKESNKIAIVLNNSHQFKIPAHMLNRNRSTQDITKVYDVTSKESLNNVKVRLGEINKHVPDGVNKLPIENKCDLKPKTVKSKEAKNVSKFEAEQVDVMDTLQTRFQSLRRR